MDSHNAVSDEVREAFRIVDARLDAGTTFEARCRGSLRFARAVEEARLLRAYMPGVLRQRAVMPNMDSSPSHSPYYGPVGWRTGMGDDAPSAKD